MKLRYKFAMVAFALLVAATLLVPRMMQVSANTPVQDCMVLSGQLRWQVDQAFAHARLTEAQQTEVAQVRQRVRELAQFRRDGALKNHDELKAESARLRAFLDAAPAQFQREVASTLESLKACEESQIERKKAALREALIQELGLPLGLLAYYATNAADSAR